MMRFRDLKPGDQFVLPNHFESRNGRVSLDDTATLELFRKITLNQHGANAVKHGYYPEDANIIISDDSCVIKLI